ncbi:MAG TPA: hypothetical protein VIH04_00085 [Nitrosarchaeum sp.]
MSKNLSLFFLFSVLVTGLIINPSVFPTSFDDSESSSNLVRFAFAEETSVNATETDITTTSVNATETEDIHEELTIFVEESRSLFEEQKEETRNVIKECQISLIAAEPSQRDEIRKQCRDNLDEIRESYKETRKIYKESFKEFRKSMDIAIREAKGLGVGASEKIAALSDIKSRLKSNTDLEKIKELRKSISEELKEEKKQLREEKREERKQMREERKGERDAMKEEKEAERKNNNP